MPAVNWDEPSSGLVSDAAPSLTLKNDQGPVLDAVAATGPAARIGSSDSIGVTAQAPLSTAVLGTNRANAVAMIGGSLSNPNLPPLQNMGGVGAAGLTNRFDSLGVAGIATGPRSVGVRGEATTSGTGVIGKGTNGGVEGTATSGTGVAGFALGGSANAEGVFGQGTQLAAGVRAEAEGGPGVDAHASAGPAVRAVSDQHHGIIAQTSGENRIGVRGISESGTGVDGFSPTGVGVSGFSQTGTGIHAASETDVGLEATSKSTHAVWAHASGSFDAAVAAFADDSASHPHVCGPALMAYSIYNRGIAAMGTVGVEAIANIDPNNPPDDDNACVGVIGRAFSGSYSSAAGVRGVAVGGGVGVVGVGSSQLGALAGRFGGDVLVTGDLEVDGGVEADHIEAGAVNAVSVVAALKLFVIDHPLDPERKVLRHACVEAPEHKTFYDGIVTLNTRGSARVRLPRWFSALNGDLRYQLTPMGRGAPDLHVAEPFTEEAGVFVVAGGHPGQSVCWQVTAIRRDPAALAQPLKVEDRKPPPRPARGPRPDGGVARELAALAGGPAELRARVAAITKAVEERAHVAEARAGRPRPAPEPMSGLARREPTTQPAVVAEALEEAQQATIRHAGID